MPHASLQLQHLENYKKALDQHAIIAVTDKAGLIEDVNDAFCRISQYSRTELLGQDHRIINSGYHDPSFFKMLWTTISSGQTWEGDICNKAKDGSLYWVQTTILPCLDSKGDIHQYVSIRTDITELKSATEKLKALTLKQQELAQELLSERNNLSRKNIALNEIIGHIDQEKDALKAQLSNQLGMVVYPLLEQMKLTANSTDQKMINLIENNLKDLDQTLLNHNTSPMQSLTPKELQICSMIKGGLTVKDIAKLLHLSPRTIDKHRENIRKKLQLTSKKINLASFLTQQNSKIT